MTSDAGIMLNGIRSRNRALEAAYARVLDGCIDERVLRAVTFLLERKREQLDAVDDVASHL